jgi:hypothetical protein
MEIRGHRLQTPQTPHVVAFAMVRHTGAETMVGWFASDYLRHLIGLLLLGAHSLGNS